MSEEGEDDPAKIAEDLFGEQGLFPPRSPMTPEERVLDTLQTIDNRLGGWRQEAKAPSLGEIERQLRGIRDGIATIALAVLFIAIFGSLITISVVAGEETTKGELGIFFVIALVFAGTLARNIERR